MKKLNKAVALASVDSCRNIASTNTPAWEVAACWQRFGPGRRG